MASNGLTSPPFVEDVVGKVEAYAGAVLIYDRTDKDAIAVEELQVDGVSVDIVGVVEEEGV